VCVDEEEEEVEEEEDEGGDVHRMHRMQGWWGLPRCSQVTRPRTLAARISSARTTSYAPTSSSLRISSASRGVCVCLCAVAALYGLRGGLAVPAAGGQLPLTRT
jgi:hypothetical protein